MIAASSPRLPRTGAAIPGEVVLALTHGIRPSPCADALDLARERARIGDGPRRVAAQGAGRQPHARVREQHLPRRGRVRDARPAELRDALHRGRAPDEVDGDGLVATRDRQRDRLAHGPDEGLELRPGELAQVEPVDDRVAELDEADAEAVLPFADWST